MGAINLIIHFPDNNGRQLDAVINTIDELGPDYEGSLTVECEFVETIEVISRLVEKHDAAKLRWRQGRPTP